MAGADRSAPADLSAELSEQAAEFDFFAALRLLECRSSPKRRGWARPRGAARSGCGWARSPSSPSPPAASPATRPVSRGLPDKLAVLLFGLFGSGGPLPLHLTLHAMDRRRQAGDDTFIDFCDLLQHRLIALFYRAWADARPQVQHDRPDQDRFRLYVGALAGIRYAGHARPRRACPIGSSFHHAGLIGCQSGHAERVETLVRGSAGRAGRARGVGRRLARSSPSACAAGSGGRARGSAWTRWSASPASSASTAAASGSAPSTCRPTVRCCPAASAWSA